VKTLCLLPDFKEEYMPCKFQFSFSVSPEDAVAKARHAVESQNGNFTGDTTSGNFDVTVFGNFIGGNYSVEGQNIHIEVTDKPVFLPCSMIESFLKKEIN
jgi:hypothetical protein